MTTAREMTSQSSCGRSWNASSRHRRRLCLLMRRRAPAAPLAYIEGPALMLVSCASARSGHVSSAAVCEVDQLGRAPRMSWSVSIQCSESCVRHRCNATQSNGGASWRQHVMILLRTHASHAVCTVRDVPGAAEKSIEVHDRKAGCGRHVLARHRINLLHSATLTLLIVVQRQLSPAQDPRCPQDSDHLFAVLTVY